MFKRIRKICLYKGCNKKSTHFGICGKRSNGLCDEHYEELQRTIDRLEELANKLIDSFDNSSNSKISESGADLRREYGGNTESRY